MTSVLELGGAGARPSGELTIQVTRRPARACTPEQGFRGFWEHALPHRGLPAYVNRWRWKNLRRVLWAALKVAVGVNVGRLCGVAVCYGRLSLAARIDGQEMELGIAGYRLVTTAGVNFLANSMRGSATITNLKFHGFGSGATAESIADTGLGTEFNTAYNPDATRPTGTQTTGATTNVYRTVGVFTPDIDVASCTEHGIFDVAPRATGNLLDRTVFSTVALTAANGDQITATYDFTIAAGG